MTHKTPPTIYLKDYKPTPHAITHVELDVVLHETATRTTSRLNIAPRENGAPLMLDGESLELISVAVDGVALGLDQYELTANCLTIHQTPLKPFVLQIVQICNPKANTELSGLYLSNGVFCTQMEAEGFRRFAFLYDRPDVMATYRVCVEAPKSVPVLLSNGNPVRSGDVAGTDRHFAIWDDPHPKPSYLFALVGGDLASVHDSFTTMSGRKVKLGIYVEKGKEDRCGWAMQSLIASMRWDETRFGREYDLDVFNIVAVSDFNMGAMENKGLNVFNDKYILARPDTATDTDYVNIERIIAHEYFHNWTGNRITCREWFQLCLKEGLTVYRDQEFTADVRSRALKRIEDVKTLRARQVPEDQGPLAHAPRPSSYIEINNFYTPTIYEKGAEICRMMHTLIGDVAFRKAMDLYFERHDGEAATVEDFVCCMADASGRDLSQFFTWYEQSGTPQISVTTKHDEAAETFDVSVSQSVVPTVDQPDKRPLHIPLAIGLLGADGNELPLHLEGTGALNAPLVELREPQQTFRFTGLRKRPVLSINRGFSAPVVLQTDATEADLLLMAAHDRDSFNRWEAAQAIARTYALKSYRAKSSGSASPDIASFASALGGVLKNEELDDAFKALMITPPPEAEIAASLGGNADSDIVHQVRNEMRNAIGAQLRPSLLDAIAKTTDRGSYVPDTDGTARRSLRYAALSLLACCSPQNALDIAENEISHASSMTAEYGALLSIIGVEDVRREAMLATFYERHKGDQLLVDKWFSLGSIIPGADAYKRIQALIAHPDFNLTTPNRLYAVIGGFSGSNFSGFNAAHGEGYRIVADTIIAVDRINQQVAARLATGFRSWRIFNKSRRDKAEAQMKRILATDNLSKQAYEILSRTLQA